MTERKPTNDKLIIQTNNSYDNDRFLLDHSLNIIVRNGGKGLMPGFHHSVAVLPLPFRRCRCVNSVRIT